CGGWSLIYTWFAAHGSQFDGAIIKPECGSDSRISLICDLISSIIICRRSGSSARKTQSGNGDCQCSRFLWPVYYAAFDSAPFTKCRLVSRSGGQCHFNCPDYPLGLDAEGTSVC